MPFTQDSPSAQLSTSEVKFPMRKSETEDAVTALPALAWLEKNVSHTVPASAFSPSQPHKIFGLPN